MSETKAVNVKVKHIRPEYNDLKAWMDDPANVYVGRGGIVFIDGERFPKKGSIWGNPFKGDGAVEKYEAHIRAKLESGEITKEQLMELKGKNLGCWCKPNPCHADVLVKLVDEYTRD